MIVYKKKKMTYEYIFYIYKKNYPINIYKLYK